MEVRIRALRDRLGAVGAVIRGEPQLRHVGFGDAIAAAVQYYGLQRWAIQLRAKETRLDDGFVWIDVGPFGLAWPARARRERLWAALAELWATGNPHYYFSPLSGLPADAMVLDVGACEGAFALECLQVKGAKQVWCFEPDERMARALKLTAERNGVADRMHVVQAVVGSSEGIVRFAEDADDPLTSRMLAEGETSGQGVVRETPAITLEAWAERNGVARVSFIKIDAEGADFDVLAGAAGLLLRDRPRIAVTTYHHPTHCNAMVDFLTKLQVEYELRAKGIVTFDRLPRPVMLHARAH